MERASLANPRLRQAGDVVLAALILLVPALINGYPLVYPDTGTYLRQAIELYGAADRPPFYSLLIFPFHLKLTLWPVALMQSLSLALAVRIVMRSLLGSVQPLVYLGTVLVLTALTSLPWHTGQLVPDAFTALLALLAFELSYGWERYSKSQRVVLSFVACGITTLHFSHLPLAIGVFIVAALVRLAQGYGIKDAIRVLLVGWTLTKVASLAFVAYSYLLIHRPAISPNSNLYLGARVLADGPGRAFLAESCPASGNVFCEYQSRLTDDADAFLLAASSPLVDATKAYGDSAVEKSLGTIVRGVIRTRPMEQLSAAFDNSRRQFLRFATLNTECPRRCGEEANVSVTIKQYFGSEYGRFRAGRQVRDAWPLAGIRAVHTAAVVAGAGALLALLIAALRQRDRLAVGFGAVVIGILVLNAGIAGSLASVHDRYQSRVIWLVPFAAMLLYARARGQRAEAAPQPR